MLTGCYIQSSVLLVVLAAVVALVQEMKAFKHRFTVSIIND